MRTILIALLMMLAAQVVADQKCDNVCQAMKPLNELFDEILTDTTMEDRYSREQELLKSSEFEAFRKNIYKCWSIPKRYRPVTVVVKVSFDELGNVKRNSIKKIFGDGKSYQAVEAAYLSVENIFSDCFVSVQLPVDDYDIWGTLELEFDSESLRQ